MKRINRKKSSLTTNNHEYNILSVDSDPYEEIYGDIKKYSNTYSVKYKRSHKKTNKILYPYNIRMYKNWKHNRKYQWK